MPCRPLQNPLVPPARLNVQDRRQRYLARANPGSNSRRTTYTAVVRMTSTPFSIVEAIGRTLSGVELSTTWGQPSLKVRGKMFACLASHSSAEPDTLVVMTDFAQRDALLEEEPERYYITKHYVDYPCVLVRLARVDREMLQDLLIGSCQFVGSMVKVKTRQPVRARVLRGRR